MGAPILKGASVPAVDLATNADGVVVDAPITVGGEEFAVTCISMGNPHAIVFLPDLGALDFERLGPLFEVHPCFPKKINTEFVQVRSRTSLLMKVWERGAGPTLACGTGACALTVAAILNGHCDANTPVVVELPGGPLTILWDQTGSGKIFMTGAAALAFHGTFTV